MASDTDLERSDERDLALRWSGRIPITARILATNIFALGLTLILATKSDNALRSKSTVSTPLRWPFAS